MRLRSKKAVITGGTTGIGAATARRFLDEGAQVLITGTSDDRLAKTVTDLGGEAAGVQAQRVDLRVLADLDALTEHVRAEFGELDVLFANAGVTYSAPLDQVTPERFDDEVAILFRGTFFTVQKLAPLLRTGSSVVLNTSCLDQLGGAGMSVYSAAKAASRSLARSFSAELAPRGIRVNAVAPGPINTPLYGKFGMPEEQVSAMAEQIVSNIPLGRFGEPAEIASAVTFLASADSSYILGEEITVDGGWTQL